MKVSILIIGIFALNMAGPIDIFANLKADTHTSFDAFQFDKITGTISDALSGKPGEITSI
jgi:hypothetical protein